MSTPAPWLGISTADWLINSDTPQSPTGSSCSTPPRSPPCINNGGAITSRHPGHGKQHRQRHELVESRMR